jgi:hypothetical protein
MAAGDKHLKLLLSTLLVVEVFLILMVFTCAGPIDRRETSDAFRESSAHPSPATRAHAEALVARDDRDAMLLDLTLLGSLIGDGVLIYIVALKIRRQSRHAPQPGPAD